MNSNKKKTKETRSKKEEEVETIPESILQNVSSDTNFENPSDKKEQSHHVSDTYWNAIEVIEHAMDKKKILSYIPKIENGFLIENAYEIIDNIHNDNLHIVIYYISERECFVYVRRMDTNDWGQDLKIIIWNQQKTFFQKISLGSSSFVSKSVVIFPLVKLYPLISKAPSRIFYPILNQDIHQINEWCSLATRTPEYELVSFDEKECRHFLQQEYDTEILDLFDSIFDLEVMKQFMKYAYLCIHPGYYSIPDETQYVDSTQKEVFDHLKYTLVKENKYIYSPVLQSNDIQFYIEPSIHSDTFEIFHIQNKLYRIKRTDNNSGWGQSVRIKVISPTSLERIEIGSSTENEKVFKITHTSPESLSISP
jgi:hypothetical protein